MNILFLGDSITDCDHCFSSDNLGYGYVKFFSEQLSSDLYVVNGGADGFTFPRILQKWDQMYSDVTWDMVFIQGGINEVGFLMDSQLSDSSVLEYLDRSASALSQLLLSLQEHKVPKIVILEPFLFEKPEYLITWRPVLDQVCERIRHAATETGSEYITMISLQDFFDALVPDCESSALSEDGIHLTTQAHQMLSQFLIHTFFS